MKKWVNELNRAFWKEEVQMIKKHKKKCWTSLALKEMQIKTTLRLHLTSARMATIEDTMITIRNIGKDGKEKGTLILCW
jgi:hypothetical protein